HVRGTEDAGSVSASMSAHRSTQVSLVMVVVSVMTAVVGRLLVCAFARHGGGFRPVLLAVNPGQHLGREAAGRTVINDLARAQPDDPRQEHLRQSDVVDV